MNKYPIYIISKSRFKSRYTVKTLERMKIPYKIVIEPQEYKDYLEFIDKENILILPFTNLGQGSIPSRNWVFEHSISLGFKKHWILDDNIKNFYIYNDNKRIKTDINVFEIMEDFTDRYSNIGLSGCQYYCFCPPDGSRNYPFMLNTRIYSCILVNNEIPYRWRGKYNEDTDLSLRLLKNGYCTVLFYYVLQGKLQTMTVKGGNTEELYKDNGRIEMALSLKNQHPDVVKIVKKYNRYQHFVDYSQFKNNKLIES